MFALATTHFGWNDSLFVEFRQSAGRLDNAFLKLDINAGNKDKNKCRYLQKKYDVATHEYHVIKAKLEQAIKNPKATQWNNMYKVYKRTHNLIG